MTVKQFGERAAARLTEFVADTEQLQQEGAPEFIGPGRDDRTEVEWSMEFSAWLMFTSRTEKS